jgi:hypothetical protein
VSGDPSSVVKTLGSIPRTTKKKKKENKKLEGLGAGGSKFKARQGKKK